MTTPCPHLNVYPATDQHAVACRDCGDVVGQSLAEVLRNHPQPVRSNP